MLPGLFIGRAWAVAESRRGNTNDYFSAFFDERVAFSAFSAFSGALGRGHRQDENRGDTHQLFFCIFAWKGCVFCVFCVFWRSGLEPAPTGTQGQPSPAIFLHFCMKGLRFLRFLRFLALWTGDGAYRNTRDTLTNYFSAFFNERVAFSAFSGAQDQRRGENGGK